MKLWKLFYWAVRHLKFDDAAGFVKCLRNDILLRIMDLSGVTPEDANRVLYSRN